MDSMSYRHILGLLETIPPLLYWNTIPVCRLANTHDNACKCAITESIIFNSEYLQLIITVLCQLGSHWEITYMLTERKTQRDGGKGGKEGRKGDKVPYWHLFSHFQPVYKLCCLRSSSVHNKPVLSWSTLVALPVWYEQLMAALKACEWCCDEWTERLTITPR